MRYLLDTNVWIQLWKSYDSPVRAKFSYHQESAIVTCSLVHAELLHGAMRYARPDRRLNLVNSTLSQYETFDFDSNTAPVYALL